MNSRRIVVLAILIVCLVMSSASTRMMAATDPVFQERGPIGFTITPADCPKLSVTVTGSGQYFITAKERVDKDGIVHGVFNFLANGTATDDAGGSYVFNYHNHQNYDVPLTGFPFTIKVNDHFNLNGQGKANQFHSGFALTATFTDPFSPPIINLLNERGIGCDPI